MRIVKLNELGYEEAIFGLSLSHYDHKIPAFEDDFDLPVGGYGVDSMSILEMARKLRPIDSTTHWSNEKKKRMDKLAVSLAFRGGGHSKFLASIVTWWYIQAPRAWWSEFDTYKVCTTAQSASTMHTLDKRPVTAEDFELGTSLKAVDNFNALLRDHKTEGHPCHKNISVLKMNLPEGWLQERQVCLNYMTLQNILDQRKGHRLKYWAMFIEAIMTQVDYPKLLEQDDGLYVA
jgi:hypothetical protein